MKKILFLVYSLLLLINVRAQAPLIEYSLQVGNLSEPVDIVNAGDGSNRLFIVQRTGNIRIWNGTTLLPNVFLNVSAVLNVSGSERGLLSMAFHPDYKNNRYFFIFYTNSSGNITLARYRTQQANPDVADAASAVVLLTIPHPGNSNHNGGKLIFGKDGFLYFGTGDGGGSNDVPNNAQNGLSLLGKMLRIDVNDFGDITPPLYSIPPGNPYLGNAAVKEEIIALGLRNPWRWSFDRLTSDMWIADVGQNAREEVDFRRSDSILKPSNYGWRCLEGSITNPSASAACPPPPNNIFPIFDYGHNASGGFVITGGYVYRGIEYPALQGYYVCTDYATGNIWLIKSASGSSWDVFPQTLNKLTNISGYGEAENGALYAVRFSNGTANSGALYKVITGTALPLKLISFTAVALAGFHQLNWEIAGDKANNQYKVERRRAGENSFIEMAGQLSAGQGAQQYSVKIIATDADCYYRLKIVGADGLITYSPVIFLQKKNTGKNIFTINKSGGLLRVTLNQPAVSLQVINTAGQVLYKRDLNGQIGMISLPAMPFSGMVFVQVITPGNSEVKKLLW